MLKERVAALKESKALLATLRLTDSLRPISDPNLPITYSSGPVKEKIRS